MHKCYALRFYAVFSCSVMSDFLQPHDSPGKNTGAGCPALLQGIFPMQGTNQGLPHCRWILYHLKQY